MHVLDILSGEEQTDDVTDRVFSLLNILHNAIKHGARRVDSRAIYRNLGVHTHLEKWMATPTILLKVIALLTLSYIANEEERDKLGKNSKDVEFLVGMLGEAEEDHKAHTGTSPFAATELLRSSVYQQVE